MSRGIEIIVKNVLKSSVKNPKETQFLIKYMLSVTTAIYIARDVMQGPAVPAEIT
jgi:hypothetical protein